MLEPNATFIGQIIVFLILLWFLAKYVVPPLARVNLERQKKIAEGLAAAERGQKDLADASSRVNDILREARERARAIEDQAARRSNEAIEAAKQAAASEGQRIVEAARLEVSSETTRAREELRREFGTLVVQGASRLLEREVDAGTHAQLIDQLQRDILRS